MARAGRDDLFRRFDAWGFDQRGWSKSTRRKYYLVARNADAWLILNRRVSLCWARSKDLQAYLFSTVPSAANRNQIRQALVGFGDFLIAEGMADANPALGLPRLPMPDYLPKPLPSSAARRVERVAPTFGPMVNAMVQLFLFAGLRKTELRTLQRSAYSDGWLRIQGKGERIRSIPLHPIAQGALESWLALAPRSRWVFPSPRFDDRPVCDTWVRRTLWDVGDAAGIERLHPHTLRHSAATELMERSDGDLRAVQVYLGHADPKTTAIYAKVRPGRLAAMVGRMSYQEVADADGLRGGVLLRARASTARGEQRPDGERLPRDGTALDIRPRDPRDPESSGSDSGDDVSGDGSVSPRGRLRMGPALRPRSGSSEERDALRTGR